jgi:hypothetical protein
MSLSPVEIGAYVVAGALAASKLISATADLWAKLPRPVAVLAPVLVACLPKIAEQAGLVKTEGDLLTLGIAAVALLLPGIAEAEKAA